MAAICFVDLAQGAGQFLMARAQFHQLLALQLFEPRLELFDLTA